MVQSSPPPVDQCNRRSIAPLHQACVFRPNIARRSGTTSIPAASHVTYSAPRLSMTTFPIELDTAKPTQTANERRPSSRGAELGSSFTIRACCGTVNIPTKKPLTAKTSGVRFAANPKRAIARVGISPMMQMKTHTRGPRVSLILPALKLPIRLTIPNIARDTSGWCQLHPKRLEHM